MDISDHEFRGYVAAAFHAIVTQKGAGDAVGVAKAAIKAAQALRDELKKLPTQEKPYGKDA